jgi:heme-degrading monooxygenase HmoA
MTKIVRLWRGVAEKGKSELYRRHALDAVFPALRRIEGFERADLCERAVDGNAEFLVMTTWRSMEAVKAFAGEACERAVVEPAARAALAEYDATVLHYELRES